MCCVVERCGSRSRVHPHSYRIIYSEALLISVYIKSCRGYNIGDDSGRVAAVGEGFVDQVGQCKAGSVSIASYLCIVIQGADVEFNAVE